ncbi:hypothetical protein PSN45_002605 [Yamadazyma tenuis]|uniref:uncharacterized protein n=1 Tax=Candida tenuis TaxID=2315449 RepID=UPI00279E7B1A|nr:hypothetical protein PSN45_002605 [Yamadazyma tenuis]
MGKDHVSDVNRALFPKKQLPSQLKDDSLKLVDWIDSLKSRFSQTLQVQNDELVKLKSSLDEDAMREEYRTRIFDPFDEYVGVSKEAEEEVESEEVESEEVESEEVESEEVESEEVEEAAVSDSDVIEILSSEEVEDEDEEVEEEDEEVEEEDEEVEEEDEEVEEEDEKVEEEVDAESTLYRLQNGRPRLSAMGPYTSARFSDNDSGSNEEVGKSANSSTHDENDVLMVLSSSEDFVSDANDDNETTHIPVADSPTDFHDLEVIPSDKESALTSDHMETPDPSLYSLHNAQFTYNHESEAEIELDPTLQQHIQEMAQHQYDQIVQGPLDSNLLELAESVIKDHQFEFVSEPSQPMKSVDTESQKEYQTDDEMSDVAEVESETPDLEPPLAPLPQPFEMDIEEEVHLVDQVVSEGSEADIDTLSEGQEVEDEAEADVESSSDSEDEGLPTFRTVAPEPAEAVLQKLKETEEKFGIQLKVRKELQVELGIDPVRAFVESLKTVDRPFLDDVPTSESEPEPEPEPEPEINELQVSEPEVPELEVSVDHRVPLEHQAPEEKPPVPHVKEHSDHKEPEIPILSQPQADSSASESELSDEPYNTVDGQEAMADANPSVPDTQIIEHLLSVSEDPAVQQSQPRDITILDAVMEDSEDDEVLSPSQFSFEVKSSGDISVPQLDDLNSSMLRDSVYEISEAVEEASKSPEFTSFFGDLKPIEEDVNESNEASDYTQSSVNKIHYNVDLAPGHSVQELNVPEKPALQEVNSSFAAPTVEDLDDAKVEKPSLQEVDSSFVEPIIEENSNDTTDIEKPSLQEVDTSLTAHTSRDVDSKEVQRPSLQDVESSFAENTILEDLNELKVPSVQDSNSSFPDSPQHSEIEDRFTGSVEKPIITSIDTSSLNELYEQSTKVTLGDVHEELVISSQVLEKDEKDSVSEVEEVAEEKEIGIEAAYDITQPILDAVDSSFANVEELSRSPSPSIEFEEEKEQVIIEYPEGTEVMDSNVITPSSESLPESPLANSDIEFEAQRSELHTLVEVMSSTPSVDGEIIQPTSIMEPLFDEPKFKVEEDFDINEEEKMVEPTGVEFPEEVQNPRGSTLKYDITEDIMEVEEGENDKEEVLGVISDEPQNVDDRQRDSEVETEERNEPEIEIETTEKNTEDALAHAKKRKHDDIEHGSEEFEDTRVFKQSRISLNPLLWIRSFWNSTKSNSDGIKQESPESEGEVAVDKVEGEDYLVKTESGELAEQEELSKQEDEPETVNPEDIKDSLYGEANKVSKPEDQQEKSEPEPQFPKVEDQEKPEPEPQSPKPKRKGVLGLEIDPESLEPLHSLRDGHTFGAADAEQEPTNVDSTKPPKGSRKSRKKMSEAPVNLRASRTQKKKPTPEERVPEEGGPKEPTFTPPASPRKRGRPKKGSPKKVTKKPLPPLKVPKTRKTVSIDAVLDPESQPTSRKTSGKWDSTSTDNPANRTRSKSPLKESLRDIIVDDVPIGKRTRRRTKKPEATEEEAEQEQASRGRSRRR